MKKIIKISFIDIGFTTALWQNLRNNFGSEFITADSANILTPAFNSIRTKFLERVSISTRLSTQSYCI